MMRELLKAELIADEGVVLKPYKCTAGRTTIGIGRNLDDVGISRDEALRLLESDIDRVEKDLDRELPWWRGRPDNVQRAMANQCFQLGINGLLKFKNMLSCLHAGDYEGAKRHGLDSEWAKQTPARAKRVTDLFVP